MYEKSELSICTILFVVRISQAGPLPVQHNTTQHNTRKNTSYKFSFNETGEYYKKISYQVQVGVIWLIIFITKITLTIFQF